jgi:hypothetical protein
MPSTSSARVANAQHLLGASRVRERRHLDFEQGQVGRRERVQLLDPFARLDQAILLESPDVCREPTPTPPSNHEPTQAQKEERAQRLQQLRSPDLDQCHTGADNRSKSRSENRRASEQSRQQATRRCLVDQGLRASGQLGLELAEAEQERPHHAQ